MRSVAKTRLASVPGTCRKRHELEQLAVPTNQYMRRYFEIANLVVIGVAIPVQLIAKQLFDSRSVKLAGRQADAVQDDEVDLDTVWPCVLVGAMTLSRGLNDAAISLNSMHYADQPLLCFDGTTIVTLDGINQTFYS